MPEFSEIYVAFCHRRPSGDPIHWILMARPEGSQRCTWYHVEGSPTQGYQLKIQANKRMDSFGIASKHFIGRIDDKNIGRLRAAAQSVPMQRCQLWTVQLLSGLETKGLVPAGTAYRFQAQVEPARDARASGSGRSRNSGMSSGGSSAMASRSSGSHGRRGH